MFNKDQKLKNKETEMNNTITEMKYTLEGINNRGTRINKWPGRQNGGNHCHREEYSKKEWKKKMKIAYETSGTVVNTSASAL